MLVSFHSVFTQSIFCISWRKKGAEPDALSVKISFPDFNFRFAGILLSVYIRILVYKLIYLVLQHKYVDDLIDPQPLPSPCLYTHRLKIYVSI